MHLPGSQKERRSATAKMPYAPLRSAAAAGVRSPKRAAVPLWCVLFLSSFAEVTARECESQDCVVENLNFLAVSSNPSKIRR